ncbi:type IV pilus twitching motility protein PilT [Planctomycetota bacterium]
MSLLNIDQMVRSARECDASDIHLIAGLPPALRVNGDILMGTGKALSRKDLQQMIGEVLNEEQQEQLERTRELCFSIFDSQSGRIRVTVYYHAGSPELSLRLCSLSIPDAETLGLPSVVDEMARKPNGLVLVAGKTGSGKTTTLNYMVDLINRERRAKIVMIEDPVEFVHHPRRSLIVQQEVYSDVLSFPRAVVHVLRQNPDVIVIGEMRELEAIQTALTAAETGHLVLATLHTPNTMQTVERITSVFPATQQKQVVLQLANSLQGAIVQDLIPSADGTHRVMAYEILVANEAVRANIRDESLHLLYNTLQTGKRDGMITMDDCLLNLYQKARITYDAAITRARNPDRFATHRGAKSPRAFSRRETR